jgi:transcriptional regulator with XRE-family HTH domain/tetratricopeptide (TPR) repeat protein
MDADEVRTIGRRVRQIRNARQKSLRVVAGLAGMSTTVLHRIETGQRALDSHSETVALANALAVAPQELTRLPVPAPANGGTEIAVDDVRVALMAVSCGRPSGQVVTVEELRARVDELHPGTSRDLKEVGAALPGLIRDLHTTLNAGRDVAELLDLAVLLHAQDTRGWLWIHSASLDLRWQAASLAQQLAQRRDTPTALGVAAWGAVVEMLASGAFDLARDELDAVSVPTSNPESMQLAGMLALSRSLVAASDKRPQDVEPALDYAEELAQRTGQGEAFWLGFGPVNVGLWRMASLLEVGDYDRAVGVAEGLNAQEHPSPERRATYWADYGRALARIKGRQDEAVRAIWRAEQLHPTRVQRNPFVREVLAELLSRSRQDAAGRELRGMAYRAGLPL